MCLSQCIETKIDEAVLRHSGALPILVNLIRTTRAGVVLHALCSLARATATGTLLVFPYALPPFVSDIDRCTDVLSRMEIRRLGVLRTLVTLLSSGNEDVQRWAVVALNHVNEKDSVPTLVEM
jgi:hypothetical protein